MDFRNEMLYIDIDENEGCIDMGYFNKYRFNSIIVLRFNDPTKTQYNSIWNGNLEVFKHIITQII